MAGTVTGEETVVNEPAVTDIAGNPETVLQIDRAIEPAIAQHGDAGRQHAAFRRNLIDRVGQGDGRFESGEYLRGAEIDREFSVKAAWCDAVIADRRAGIANQIIGQQPA